MNYPAAIVYFYSDLRSHSTLARTNYAMSYLMAKVWTFESWARGFVFVPSEID